MYDSVYYYYFRPQRAQITLHKLRPNEDADDLPDEETKKDLKLTTYHRGKSSSLPITSSYHSVDRHTNSMLTDNGFLLASKQTTV